MDLRPPNLINSISLLNKSEKNKPSNDSSNSLRNQLKKIWIESYGCSANFADGEIVAGLLKKEGYELVDDSSQSDLNIIMTCSVKDATEHRMINRIQNLSNKPLVVAGCLPKAERKKVERLNPYASLIGPDSIARVNEVVKYSLLGKKMVHFDRNLAKINLPRIRINPIISIVEIGSGCMSDCTFCQTKIAKGMIQSYRIGDIVRQIKNDVRAGCKEVWLTSTDNGCYGLDHGTNLNNLLNECCGIEGDFKIRVGMMNPMYLENLIEEMIEIYSNNDKIFKFIHIPVQSGSNKVLQDMKRDHDVNIIYESVKKFRKKIPQVTISTDIIVGFPSETDVDFEKTIDLVNDLQFDIVNISKYSSRPGTFASQMKKINTKTIKERSKSLNNLCRSIISKRNKKLWKNWVGEIIIDEINHANNNIIGRNYAYKSVLLTSKNMLHYGSAKEDTIDKFYYRLGDKIKIQVCGYSNYSLLGYPCQ
ncbi:MAG: tRNA (N(6)-L-threonylcarbamoyladenosine(37)-C(2))-methylthiotransferase [Nitrososphaeraceae archaeon]